MQSSKTESTASNTGEPRRDWFVFLCFVFAAAAIKLDTLELLSSSAWRTVCMLSQVSAAPGAV